MSDDKPTKVKLGNTQQAAKKVFEDVRSFVGPKGDVNDNTASRLNQTPQTIKQAAGTVFNSETPLTTKLTVVGGVSTGVTFALTGLRSLRNGLSKDEDNKRDYGLAALGAAETVGGAFIAALFWNKMAMAGVEGGVDPTPLPATPSQIGR
ncbi:MAG: hypothetical protein MK052_01795 [Alphaproteobacteria bacterium]|nr:hypothetical protein [Alphaproteobacteria bacterium]